MKPKVPVLEALARLYERSKAGQTGLGKLDFQPKFEDLLQEAGCTEGDQRDLADREIRALDGTLLKLEFAHHRTCDDIFKVRLPLVNEAALYQRLGRPSPTEMRSRWVALFQEAMDWAVPEELSEPWRDFCQRGKANAVHWQNMRDFRRDDLEPGRDLLILVTKLMAWRQPDHFVRAVSCQLCADSKRLLGQRGLLERLLSEATNGRVKNYGDLGILDMPAHVLVAGPLRLRFPERVLDLGSLREGSSFSEADIARAVIECPATRCVTVENKTSFHQRAVLHPEDLHIHTSYPGSAVLVLLGKLPRTMDFFHAGDTDPAGFDILRDLRHSARLPIRSLGMEVASCVDGPLLSPGELRLLETLVQNPDLVEERPALEMMLVSKRKQRAFEQEHRSPQ